MIRPTEIEMWEVELPLRQPLVSATHRFDLRRSIVIRLVNGASEGWGEAAAYPGHTRDTPQEAWQLVTTEARRLLGAGDPVLIEGSAATAGLDQAMTALQASADGVPLAAHVGGGVEPVRPSAAIALGTTTEVVENVAAAVAAGYRHVKLKTGPGHLDSVRHVIQEFPDLGVAVDANGSFSRPDLADVASLDGLGLEYIEQPLGMSHLQGHVQLQQQLFTPICLDESVRRLGDVVTIATAGAARAVALKPGRLGPTLCQRAFKLATRHGLDVKIGGLVETGVGKHSLVSLATHPSVTLPSDLTSSTYFFSRDLVTPPWQLDSDGMLMPRHAIDVDRNALEDLAVRHHRFRR